MCLPYSGFFYLFFHNWNFLERKVLNNSGKKFLCNTNDFGINDSGPPRLARPPRPRFWVSLRSYKKQPVKKIWGRILGLVWLKFAVASLRILLRQKDIKSSSWVKKVIIAKAKMSFGRFTVQPGFDALREFSRIFVANHF